MLTALVVLLRTIGLICKGHRAVALENLAVPKKSPFLLRQLMLPAATGRQLLDPCSGNTRSEGKSISIVRDCSLVRIARLARL
jgi:hypothetical protein